MPYIIGTAGHIDHGKTSLIKALTGADTDRLKEEKERGISIDLGFAHLSLPDGSEAGIVDVPGHERFIRNMLAGAHGIDLVLFTVAADDGVMPQTEEHLDIVHLLGVRTALFVITKVDLVSEARVREVEEEIEILTFETALEGSPVVHFSAVSEQGLEDVRSGIHGLLERIDRPAPSGFFRLPVDRVFVLQGHGVIVTGTALAGEVRTGDHVHAVPGGQKFRVRSIQVHGQSVETAGWGQRVALNLTGQERGALERGHMICHEELTLASTRFDAHLEVRPAAAKGIKNHQRVRIHLGTAERMGKLVFLGDIEKVEPKETVYCQVLLTEPLLVMRGDHFIVRDETAQKTLGGGEVVDPRARRHRRRERDVDQRLRTLHQGDTPDMIRSFLEGDASLATGLDAVGQFLNLKRDETRAWLERTEGLRAFDSERERVYTTEEKWSRFRERLRAALEEFHRGHPLAPGMDLEEVRARLAAGVSARLFRDLADLLAGEGMCVREGNHLRLPGHRVEMGAREKSLSAEITAALGRNPLAPPYLKEMEKALGVERPKLNEVIRVMERQGEIVRVTTELYYLRDSIDRIKADLYSYFETHEEMSAATFRDILQSSRKYTIPVLEHFDRTGVTMRVGDVRKLKPGRS
ncbi:MAG: selenocysteine-specific translation elongation factor [Deltaproteobacteria bacterium]|nr:selenocysteine-specific translation elongation factor [Deltaproteobacteria bacterium]